MDKASLPDEGGERRLFASRVIIMLMIVASLTAILLGRLVYVDVWRRAHYAALARRNLMRPVPVIPPRGLILDRRGIVLADNYPTYSLTVEPHRVADMARLLARIHHLIGFNQQDRRAFNRRLHAADPYGDVVVRRYLSTTEADAIATHLYALRGARLVARLHRNYPLGGLAADVVGYVAPLTAKELAHHPRRDAGYADAGQSGVEARYQRQLMGRRGVRDIEADAQGRPMKVLRENAGVPGDNLYLTISAQMQAVATEMFKGRRGAAVAMNPRTGAVLALVSSPTFNPNRFVTGISRRRYRALIDDPGAPLDNRVLDGLYPPGSSIKPFFAYAALQTPWFHPNRLVLCRGTWHIPGNDHLFHDWLPWGMGRIGLRMALEESSDVYFYKLAYRLGIWRMARYLADFGFGRPTGIDLPGESAGVVPTRRWIKAHDSPWYEGETIITGIGQGPLLVTPLQLADAMGALAHHGVRMRPHVVRAVENPLAGTVRFTHPHADRPIPHHRRGSLHLLLADLTRVVSGSLGTAHIIAHGLPYAVAGKTGTAQLWSVPRQGVYRGPRLHSDALFVAMAPVPDPRIVVAVVLEHAGFGVRSAIPTEIARALINLDLLGHVHVRNASAARIARFVRARKTHAPAAGTLTARLSRSGSLSMG
ncbi:MAG: penicillin-binding protein 2 [Gammaproteobacteria bacterium]|nr:penicillin-binding protein 2 [Gammaproteobacteria bacterium]